MDIPILYMTGDYDFALTRLTSDGTLDRRFGTRGRVRTDFGKGWDSAAAVGVQDDGKIVVAGSTKGTAYDFALALYTSRGRLDRGFG